MNTVKTILYMGSLHGFFTFYVPFPLAYWAGRLLDTSILHYVAPQLWIVGAWIIIICSVDMVRRGDGTPAHADPPKQLLRTGLYRHVRNPIYLGALLVLLGHIVWSGSGLVIAYFLCYVIAFQILVVIFEEPVLRKTFGKEYEEYCSTVPRWIPRLK